MSIGEGEKATLAQALSLLEKARQDASSITFSEATNVCLEWLLGQGSVHWYCPGAGKDDSNLRSQYQSRLDIATFLIRLSQFQPKGRVVTWQEGLKRCLAECSFCVEGYCRAKERFIDRDLSLLTNDTSSFSRGLQIKSSAAILASLVDSPLNPNVLHQILLSPEHFQNEEIIAALPEDLPDLPISVPSPGLLLLPSRPEARLRAYGRQQLLRCFKLDLKTYKDSYNWQKEALEAYATMLSGQASVPFGTTSGTPSLKISDDQRTLWQGFAALLESLSSDLLLYGATPVVKGKSREQKGAACAPLIRLVTSHLDDQGAHWINVVKAFEVILKTCGKATWGEGDIEYAAVVMHSVLDNPALEEAIESRADFSSWIEPFLHTVANYQPIFPPCLSAIIVALTDNLQRIRFDVAIRVRAADAAFSTLQKLFYGTSDPRAWPHLSEARRKTLEVHGEFIASVAFSAKYAHPPRLLKGLSEADVRYQQELQEFRAWEPTCTTAQKLIRDICYADATALAERVANTAAARSEIENEELKLPRIPSSLSSSFWEKLYSVLRANPQTKALSTGIMLQALLPLTDIQTLIPLKGWGDKITSELKGLLKRMNSLMKTMRDPLSDLLQDVADMGASTLLNNSQSGSALMQAMLSPVETIHSAVIAVVNEALDCESRADCIKALLQKYPKHSLNALENALKKFISLSVAFPEVCDNAMRLARCLTNVVDALCDNVGGLLRESSWIDQDGVKSTLPNLWSLMCESISVIFAKTPEWAEYFENEAMTAWMRDVLIFADTLVTQVRTFEAAATGSTSLSSGSSSPIKQSAMGRRMIEALGFPILHMISWLRLNDVDLLRQSVSIICKTIDRFAKAEISLPSKVIVKIRKIAQSDSSSKTLLRPQEVFRLVIAIKNHPKHKDEMADIDVKREETKIRPDKAAQSDRNAQKEWWAKQQATLTKVKGYKSSTASPVAGSSTTPIDLDDDVGYQSGPVYAIPPTLKPVPKVAAALTVKPASKPSKVSAKQTAATTIKKYNFSHSKIREKEGRLSSDDDEDSEDDRKPTGLQALAEAQKPITTIPRKPDGERRTVKLLDMAEGSSGTRALRPININSRQAEKAALMRFTPDFSALHRIILQWDISSKAQAPSNLPPPSGKVPLSFSSAHAYISCYEPLLMLEFWQQISQARDTMDASNVIVKCDVSGRQSIDDFTDVFLAVKGGDLPEGCYFVESDLALLRSGSSAILAKIQEVNRVHGKTSIILRCHLGSDRQGFSSKLVPRSECSISKLTSLRTTQREYAALMALPYFDLLPDILRPKSSTSSATNPTDVAKMMKSLRLNEPQGQAIIQATRQDGFTLIQGPPGTGKTSTIVGLISALCSERRGSTKAPARLLLCAPSNAAIDEVVKRLKDGVRDLNGGRFVPNVVRIGSRHSVNISAQDVFIDELVERKAATQEGSGSSEIGDKIAKLRSEIDTLRQDRQKKQTELEALGSTNTAQAKLLEAELPKLRRALADKNTQLQETRDRQTQSMRALETARRKYRMEILGAADVVCSTLSGAGHDYVAALPFDFDTVIIDEAAQSVEPSSLIPMRYGCKKCILVGDPKQLPPTILSRLAEHQGYDQSLFLRIHKTDESSTHLLSSHSIQYRMHPAISEFPSAAFYQARLKDGPNMAELTGKAWHKSSLFPPYAFMHVKDGREEKNRFNSFKNTAEVRVAISLYGALTALIGSNDVIPTVGIVSAYSGQLAEMKKQFKARFGASIFTSIDFNTVDGFQGQEKDIIILSCVRGGVEDQGIGFLTNVNRMNVALTRARSSLFVLGNRTALERHGKWRDLTEDAEQRGCLLDKFLHVLSANYTLIDSAQVDASTFTNAAAAQSSSVAAAKATPKTDSRPKAKAKASPIKIPEGIDLMTPQQLSQQRSPRKNSLSGSNSNKKRSLDEDAISKETATPVPNKRPKIEDAPAIQPPAVPPRQAIGPNGKGVYVRKRSNGDAPNSNSAEQSTSTPANSSTNGVKRPKIEIKPDDLFAKSIVQPIYPPLPSVSASAQPAVSRPPPPKRPIAPPAKKPAGANLFIKRKK